MTLTCSRRLVSIASSALAARPRIDALRVGLERLRRGRRCGRPGRPSATATRSVNQAATSPSARSIASVRARRSARLAGSAPSRLIRFASFPLPIRRPARRRRRRRAGPGLAALGGDGESSAQAGRQPSVPARRRGGREQRSAPRGPAAQGNPSRRPRSRSPTASAVSAASASGRRRGAPQPADARAPPEPAARTRPSGSESGSSRAAPGLRADEDQVGERGGSSSVFSSAFWLSSPSSRRPR